MVAILLFSGSWRSAQLNLHERPVMVGEAFKLDHRG